MFNNKNILYFQICCIIISMNEIKDFIAKNKSSKNFGLIINLEDKATLDIIANIEDIFTGFKLERFVADLIDELLIQNKIIIDLKRFDNVQVLYDIAHGWASGQINVVNKFINPKYENSNIIVLADRNTLDEENKNGRDWLVVCGLTYQNI